LKITLIGFILLKENFVILFQKCHQSSQDSIEMNYQAVVNWFKLFLVFLKVFLNSLWKSLKIRIINGAAMTVFGIFKQVMTFVKHDDRVVQINADLSSDW